MYDPRCPYNELPFVAVKSDEETIDEEEEDGLALGQLTISDDNQIRFRGKSSGLHLLDQSVRHANFEQAPRIWHLNDGHAETRVNVEELDIPMPSIEVQMHLLGVFQDFTYAAFPILDLVQLWGNFHALNRGEHVQDKNLIKLLLLAIYSISARQSMQHSGHRIQGTEAGPGPGDEFFDRAKLILNWVYRTSHIVTCQTLLLLALREFGVGSLTQAWMYAGMAIRMGQDLGLHRSADHWIRNGKNIMDEGERTVRKRIWYGCLQIDKYMSMFMGQIQ